MKRKYLVLFAICILSSIFLTSFVWAANEVIEFQLDKNLYAPGENINVSGKLFSGDNPVSLVNITISLNDTNSYASTDSNGFFSKLISAPDEGSFNMTLSYGSANVIAEIRVSTISEINLAIASSASDALKTLIFVSNKASVGINDSGTITGSKLYANFTNNGTVYYAIAQKDTGESEYNTLFINTNVNFSGSIKFQYLVKGSKVGLGSGNYELFFIDPSGSKAFLLKTIEPVFYGTGSEWAKLFILALNSSGNVIPNLTSVRLEHYNSFGVAENITNSTESPAQVSLSKSVSGTTYYGFTTQDLFISSTGGKHHLIVEGISHISYFVEKFTLNSWVETTDGTKVSNAQTGQQVVLKATVVDLDTGAATTSAAVSAIVVDPSGEETYYTLVADANKQFTANVTLDSSLTGTYSVSFSANYSGTNVKKDYRFNVKSYDLFMDAFSPGKGQGDSIAPNSWGYIIIGAKDLGSGEFANLSDLTNNCNLTKIYLSGIYNDKNNASTLNFSTMILADLFTETSAEPWVQEEIEDNFGEKACAIKFRTPTQTGSYRLEVVSIISNETITLKDYMEVTSIFSFGMPSDCTTGSWSESVQPGSQICFKVNAYDAITGQQINPANITDINIIEIYSQSEGVVTDLITNFSLKNFSDNSKGFTFITSNASLGPHFVKFRIKANTSINESIGAGNSWFVTELWKVWAYPYCEGNSMFCNFGAQSNITLKAEAFTAGFGAGKEDITISVSSIKNFETGETISISSDGGSSCTTVNDNSSSSQNASSSQSGGKVTPAYCTLTIPVSNSSWDSGDYEVKLTATDSDENTMDIYSWFRVENFRFWAWNRNWEITSSQDAVFDITLQSFEGQNILADVSISKIYYMGSKDMWMAPKEINISGGTQIINGSGTFTLAAGNFTGLKSGFYEIVFNAVSGSGSQTTRAGFSLNSFVVFVNNLGDNNERSYEKNGNLTINVSAFDSINWSTWPPSGTPHNITNISVVRIVKDGMWDFPYKARGKDSIGDTNNCSGTTGNCILTVPLTNFDQSQYEVTIEVTDASGSTSQAFYWFKTETYTLTIPEIQDWRTVLTSNKLTDTMEVTLSTDATCGTTSDSVEEPVNVTSCLFDSNNRLPTINGNDGMNNDLRTVFLLDKTNVSNATVYINDQNETNVNGMQRHNNFSAHKAGPLGVYDNFTDANGYSWSIIQIDTGLGKIKLKFRDGVVMSRTNTASGEGQTENSVEYPSLYIINKSLSKSGIFLYSGSSGWEDKFWDDEWANIDLDADGDYNCNPGNNHTGPNPNCEEYFILLADRVNSSVYDTLLLSPTRNMTAGVNSYTGLGGAGAIRTNISANPIYLLNLIYSETSGIGKYQLVTTTNKAGWPGRNLGVFQLGSEQVKIPVMVASPSTKQGLANKTVVIDKLRTFGTMSFEETAIPSAVVNTSSNGIAILDLNLSGVPSGEYLIIMQVNDSGTLISSSNEWDNPQIQLRSFSISNLFGVKSRLNNIVEWSNSSGNLFELNSAEGSLGSNTLRLQCGNNDRDDMTICHVDDWRFKELWVDFINSTSGTVLKDATPYNWRLENASITGEYWNLSNSITITTDFGGNMTYVINSINMSSQLVGRDKGQPETPVNSPGSPCSFIINITSTAPGTNITWDVYQTCPWSSDYWPIEIGMTHSIDEPEFLWGLFNISAIGPVHVNLNMLVKTITLSSPVESLAADLETGNDGRVRVVTNALNTGYDLYFYNSIQTKTRDDLENRSNMLDRMAVVNSATNEVNQSLRFGQPITGLNNLLDGKAAVQAEPWNFYVYLSNLSINDHYIYPLPWACDDKKFYVASFSEQDLGTALYDCQQGAPLSSRENYLILFDSMCDGISSITNAKFDDDPVLDDSWANIGGQWRAYDFDHIEEGVENLCQGGPGQNASESWIEIGRESWPLSITKYDELSSGMLDLFKSKWSVQPNENITNLTLWVQAKNFDGTLINGTINLTKLSGKSYTCGMMQEEEIVIPTSDGNITNSIGYLDLNLFNISSSDLVFKFTVNDNTNENRTQNIAKQFWYGPAEMNAGGGGGMGMMVEGGMPGEGGGCGDVFKGGGGGGGPGGFEMDPEMQAEVEACLANNDTASCETALCAWIPEGFFDELAPEPPIDACLPCFVMDDKEEACDQMNNSCQWIPAFGGDPGTGICDPIVS